MEDRNCGDCRFRTLCSTRKRFLAKEGSDLVREIVKTSHDYVTVMTGMRKLLAENCHCFTPTPS